MVGTRWITIIVWQIVSHSKVFFCLMYIRLDLNFDVCLNFCPFHDSKQTIHHCNHHCNCFFLFHSIGFKSIVVWISCDKFDNFSRNNAFNSKKEEEGIHSVCRNEWPINTINKCVPCTSSADCFTSNYKYHRKNPNGKYWNEKKVS